MNFWGGKWVQVNLWSYFLDSWHLLQPKAPLIHQKPHKRRVACIPPAAMCCSHQLVWVQGPIVVGAGPSGLAAAACLKEKGIDSLVLERSSCLAPLWQLKMYDRLSLHLPRQFCELPLFPFPASYPDYPTKQQFVAYLESYAAKFGINPMYNHTVVCAEFDERLMLWRVRTTQATGMMEDDVEYVSQWLVVATGENSEAVLPMIDGLEEFRGSVIHTSAYKSGSKFAGKTVLVVGCGNSGMEVCLDLCNHNGYPHIVVRDAVCDFSSMPVSFILVL